MVFRHPFPGPGVRILGEVKKRYAELLRLADDVFPGEPHRQVLRALVPASSSRFKGVAKVQYPTVKARRTCLALSASSSIATAKSSREMWDTPPASTSRVSVPRR